MFQFPLWHEFSLGIEQSNSLKWKKSPRGKYFDCLIVLLANLNCISYSSNYYSSNLKESIRVTDKFYRFYQNRVSCSWKCRILTHYRKYLIPLYWVTFAYNQEIARECSLQWISKSILVNVTIIVHVFITFPLRDSQYIHFHVKVNYHFCSRTVLATTAIASLSVTIQISYD